MATLETEVANAARKSTHAPGPKDGEIALVDIELLDENPFQPRLKMDAAELEELATSIARQGLLQPIIVRPKTDQRFVTVAGHRRVAAFRRLREAASGTEEKQRFSRIPAVVRLALDDTQFASMAYDENVKRTELTAVEEGRALDRMIDAGLATTNEELATLTSQPIIKVRRLRRLTKAPKVIMNAIETGLMVSIGRDESGAEQEKRRHLDMMAGLQFIAAYEHLEKTVKGPKLDERLTGLMKRALAQNWSLRRLEDFVKDLIKGKPDEASPSDEAATQEAAAVYERSARRFVVDLTKLRKATPEQLEALRAAVDALFRTGQEAAAEGDHR